MSAQPNPDLPVRLTEWFAANRGRRVMVEAGAYDFGPDEVPEGSPLTVTTTIRDRIEAAEGTFREPTIVVQLGDPPEEGSLFVAPGRLLHVQFGKPGHDFLRLYFTDMAFIYVLVVS